MEVGTSLGSSFKRYGQCQSTVEKSERSAGGETVYIPSMHAQGNSTSNSGAGNIAAHEKLSPEGKEYTGVKEPEQPTPVAPTPPAPVAEVPVPVPAPPPANTEKPNVKPELEVLPQLPELPEVKPEKETHKKKRLNPKFM